MIRLLVACLLIATAFAQLDPITQGLVSNIQSMMNASVNPCQDFYSYACGTFVANNPAPNTTDPYIYIPAITGIMVGNDKLLAHIVEQPYPLINDLYNSCLLPEANVTSDFENLIDELAGQLQSLNFSDPVAFWSAVSILQVHSIEVFFQFIQSNNNANPQLGEIIIGPGGTGIDQDTNITDYTQSIVTSLETFTNVDPVEAKQMAALIIGIEQFIYEYENSPPTAVVSTNYSSLDSLTSVPFHFVIGAMGVQWPEDATIAVVNTTYFSLLADIRATFSEEQLQSYLIWRSISTIMAANPAICWEYPQYAPLLCPWVSEYYPLPPPYSQEVVCRYFVYNILGDYVGLIFSDLIVNTDVVQDIRDLTVGIQTAFGNSLTNLTWLDATSLASVKFKLSNVEQIIGHPYVLDRYEGVTTDASLLVENWWSITQASTTYTLNSIYAPFNRTDFEFPSFIVNAFYSPYTNTINFPAGILESPMFSSLWPKLFQYSRLGYVVGHENTHGFDNQGSEFNAYGQPGDIFDAATRTNFNAAAQCIANYYSNYIAYGNTPVNGQQTLPENIADIGGVKNSWRAYQNWVAANGDEFTDGELIQGLTTDQVFFINLGQTWCTSENVAYLEMQVVEDVHSPSKWRVNGPLSQFSEFAAAWQCPPNTPMNPASRCDLW